MKSAIHERQVSRFAISGGFMKNIRVISAAAIAACAFGYGALHAADNSGSELRVLCSNGIGAAMRELQPEAEKAIGRKLSIEFSASTLLKKEIDGGAPFDLTIMTPGLMD